MHRQIKYSLAKATDCFDQEGKRILSFTIRTTDGEDETVASKSADARGTGMSEELIRLSLIAYTRENDGQTEEIQVKQPFIAFDKWSTKVRNFCVAAWKRLATPDDKEMADFFASGSETE